MQSWTFDRSPGLQARGNEPRTSQVHSEGVQVKPFPLDSDCRGIRAGQAGGRKNRRRGEEMGRIRGRDRRGKGREKKQTNRGLDTGVA